MIHKTRGLVLHQIKYRESGIIIHVFTEKYGRQSFIAQGLRRKGSSGKVNLLQPCYQLDLDFYYKESKDLHRLKEFRPSFTYTSIPFDLFKRSICLFLAEVLYHCLRTQEALPELYSFLSRSFIILDQSDNYVGNFHLQFLVSLTRYLGFLPNDTGARDDSYLDMRDGVFRSTPPNHPFYVPNQFSPLLLQLIKNQSGYLEGLELTHAERTQLLDYLLEYYQLHDQQVTGLKSLKILKEVFN